MSAMGFHLPRTIEEAAALLAADPQARCLAGGATLVALMNAGLVQPSALVSLRQVDGLMGIARAADGSVRIGAMTPHRVMAAAGELQGAQRVVRQAAAVIANPPVRNMGTIGGAVAFADPGADYPPALVAAVAQIELAGVAGARRRVAASEFFTGWYETVLTPGELVVAIHLPGGHPGAIARYDKLARVEGDYATVSIALVLTMSGRECGAIAIAVGACGPKPLRLPEAEAQLTGGTLDDEAVAAAGRMLAEAADPVDDVRASADYRRRVIPRLLLRAIRSVLAEAA